MNDSFFIKKINDFFGFTQNLFAEINGKNRFIKYIDKLILFFITLLLISLPFASTKTIGTLAGIGFLTFIAKLFLKKGEKLSFNSFDFWIVLFVLITGLSTVCSSLFMPALKGYTKVLVYFFSYLTFASVLRNRPQWSYYILAIIGVTAFSEAIFAVLQNFSGIEAIASWQDKTNVSPELLMTRVYGTLQPFNPNLLGGYLTASVSSVIGIFFFCIYKKKLRPGIYSLFAVVTILAAIVFSGSRGAYIATAATLLSIVLISGHIIRHDFREKTWLKKLWVYTVLAGALAVIGIILISPALQHRIMSILTFREDSSNSFRLNVYASSFKMFLDNWLIGIGPGNEVFRQIYGLYMRAGFDALGAYSVPLEIAAESGIFALAAFGGLILSIFLKSAKIILNNKNIEQKIIVSCCLAGIIGIMTHGLVDTIFFRPQVQILFWMYAAILGANALQLNPTRIILK